VRCGTRIECEPFIIKEEGASIYMTEILEGNVYHILFEMSSFFCLLELTFVKRPRFVFWLVMTLY